MQEACKYRQTHVSVPMLGCTEDEPLPCPIICQNFTRHLMPENEVHYQLPHGETLTVHQTASPHPLSS